MFLLMTVANFYPHMGGKADLKTPLRTKTNQKRRDVLNINTGFPE